MSQNLNEIKNHTNITRLSCLGSRFLSRWKMEGFWCCLNSNHTLQNATKTEKWIMHTIKTRFWSVVAVFIVWLRRKYRFLQREVFCGINRHFRVNGNKSLSHKSQVRVFKCHHKRHDTTLYQTVLSQKCSSLETLTVQETGSRSTKTIHSGQESTCQMSYFPVLLGKLAFCAEILLALLELWSKFFAQ